MNNTDIHNNTFDDLQRATPINSSEQSLNNITENNKHNIMIYSKLEKLESDIEEIKNILIKNYNPPTMQYQMQPSLFAGHNITFMKNANNNNNNKSKMPLF